MSLTTKLAKIYFQPRLKEIERFRNHPAEVQDEEFRYLLREGCGTRFGQEHGFKESMSKEEFQRQVPVSDYEDFHDYILRSKDGENNLIWPTDIKWFAKSSGTTDAKSKYIPVTQEGLRQSHLRGPKDVIGLYLHNYPDSRVLDGKTLTLGGSKKIEREGETAYSGDLSAILIENTPWWTGSKRVPTPKTALIPDFEEKVRKICMETVGKDVRAFAGVPSWNLVMMNKILDYTGAQNLLEVWPRLELFMHGGMNFNPYREQYRKLIPSPEMHYMETYNASEGFFAIADDPMRNDMLLMLDYHTFYEFLPVSTLHDTSKAIPLEDVRTGINYAMIITSSNGLWRYMIGDTVEFTTTTPYRIRITGRTKHFINAFGEEIVIENAESAIHEACQATDADVAEYTAAPIYMDGRTKGAHEWVIEFRNAPQSLELFTQALDQALQRVNSDYEAKRFKDTTLVLPKITPVPQGTFMRWMADQGKIGGQNKVPRLFNDRTYVDQILMISSNL